MDWFFLAAYINGRPRQPTAEEIAAYKEMMIKDYFRDNPEILRTVFLILSLVLMFVLLKVIIKGIIFFRRI